MSATWAAKYARPSRQSGWTFASARMKFSPDILDAVYLGAGAYGMSAATRLYFDKSLADLTLPEAALLVGLIQAPSRYDPIRNLIAAHRRAALVIDAMLETGAIDATAAEKARARPATLKLSSRTARAGGWYTDWIAKHELPKISGSVQRVMRVRTTLQPDLQQLAERVVNEALMRTGEARGASQAALVAMRPDGSVVAMVGGRDYSESQFNRAVDARRQPGSAFKLFVYYAALQNGYSPDDTIDASPVEVGKWRPENYGGQEYGYMTLSQAFAHSVNSAAIRLGMTVGLDKVVAAARELGLVAPLAKVPSMGPGHQRGEPARSHRSLCFGSRRPSVTRAMGNSRLWPRGHRAALVRCAETVHPRICLSPRDDPSAGCCRSRNRTIGRAGR